LKTVQIIKVRKYIGVSGALQNFLVAYSFSQVEMTCKHTQTYTSTAITLHMYTQCRERINNLENVHSSTIKIRQHFSTQDIQTENKTIIMYIDKNH